MKKISLTLGTSSTANVLTNSYTASNLSLRQTPGTTNFELVDSGMQNIDLQTIKNEIKNQTLVPGAFYLITDADYNLYGGTNVLVKAVGNNKISSEGEGIFYTPKYDQDKEGFGIWTDKVTNATVTTSPGNPIDFSILDTTFNFGDKFNGAVYAFAKQSDGKIIVGGQFSTYDNIPAEYIARLNTDGTLDTTFSANITNGFDYFVNALAIQSDGKIIVGGQFSTYDNIPAEYIARLNTDGTLDTTFSANITNGFDYFVNALAIQSDGKIIVGGQFSTYDNIPAEYIARLNTDGTLDTTFSANITNGFNNGVTSLAIQSNGKIIAGGFFTTYDNIPADYIARLNTDGTLDGTFESNSGTGFDYFVYALAIQSNGKIIVGGAFTTYDSVAAEYIARLNTDGTIDTSFDSDPGFDTVVRALSIQSSGQIIVGGDFGTYDGNISDQIARLNSDGTFDKDFSNIEADEEVNIVKIQPADDFILLGGGFSTYDGNSSYYIVRLDTLGKYDTTFVTGDGFNGVVNSIDLDPSNNIYLGGNFTQYDGITQSRIVKLGTNGAIDGTFESNSGTGFDREVYSVVYTPSTGLIYVGGNFTEYNGSSSNKIISLNTDGTIYTSLNVGTGCNGDVRAIAVPGDANVIIGGDFTDYDGNSYNRIVKLQYSTGAVDTSFVVGSGFDGVVKTIEVQQDDKILVGGDFTSYNGRKCNGIVRLESTGEVDLTFNSGFGFDGSVNSIKIQSDDQILVGGDFTSYNNVPKSHFVRLNIDGSIDKTYGVISGFKGGKSSTVKSIDVQFSNDNCVVGGSFNFFNDNEDVFSNVVRLNAHGGTVQTTTSGSGTGFSPNLSIKGGVVTVNYILNYGYGYLPTDTITVGGGDLGGTPGTDDVVLTVDSSIVYTASDKVIWGGKVWENINGNLGSATASDIFTLDQTEWTGVAFNDTDYNVSNS